MEQNGLTTEQVLAQRKHYGKNIIEAESSFSILKTFFSQFANVINAILLVAGVASFFLGHNLDGVFILAIIILNAILGFVQEYRAEKSLEKLKHLTAPHARVKRDGKDQEIFAQDLVPGDIVILEEGSRIPADGTLIDTTHLELDESILTGESLAIIKKPSDQIFLGTLVNKGNGVLKVTAIGMQTQFGKIAQTLSSIETEQTPLQQNLGQLGKTLSIAALAVGFFIIPIGLLTNRPLFDLILVSATIGLAAIPEGLPAVITIAFAVGGNRLAKKNAIVRKMAAIETLGAMQVVLSDKTGTITQNQMQVKKYWLANEKAFPKLIESCLLGNTASLAEKGDGTYEAIGDQTDGALLLWTKSLQHTFRQPDAKVLDEYTLDANSKLITTVWKHGDKKHIYVRGAPESIIQQSALSQEQKETLTQQYESFAKEGLRTIAFATKIMHHKGTHTRKDLEASLTFIGFVGIYDAPRPEVIEAIQKARVAGIHVCMVTGDNPLTALAIAQEIGLIQQDEDVMTGEELAKLSDEQLSQVILKTRIFARTKPEQKLRVTQLLQGKGLVVGVTGDGVNDALALKKADVGISMGQGGTDVAREASDVVLTDNNFATLIRAIEEGRIIYKNITNGIIYLLSGNLAEISLVFLAVVFQFPFPLLPTQILWINLVTDSLPAIALATGSRDETVLQNKPRNPKEPILNKKRLLQIVGIGFGLSGTLLLTFWLILPHMSEAQARTIIFNGLIYLHLVIVLFLGWHSLKKGNKFLIFTILLIAAVQLIITFVPFFQQIFHLAI
ncbi:MAG TPA: cation-transporting P-type ATPase [Patescibacteria group bacterium]|nr:cation-transporting P-type ATPase [Patescibacteria group bacterium]